MANEDATTHLVGDVVTLVDLLALVDHRETCLARGTRDITGLYMGRDGMGWRDGELVGQLDGM